MGIKERIDRESISMIGVNEVEEELVRKLCGGVLIVKGKFGDLSFGSRAKEVC